MTREHRSVLRRLCTNRVAFVGLTIVGLVHAVALAAPYICSHDPSAGGDAMLARFLRPSWEHLLGTDRYSRDVLSRVLHAGRVSLIVGSFSVLVSVTIGTIWGAIAGYVGGKIDAAMMRLVDTFLAFPAIVLLMTVVGLWGSPSPWVIAIVIGLMAWMGLARIVRAQFVSLKERDFYQAARALGAGPWILITRHLLPHTLGPIIVFATLQVGDIILLEAGLSYLGMSVDAPSWGNIIYDNKSAILSEWWIPFSAGFAIVLTVTGYNLLGDGLRDVLDPRQARDRRGA